MPQFHLEILLNSEDAMEALRANKHNYKRIIKLSLFWNKVYISK